MPESAPANTSNTFLRLPAEKRSRIVEEAVREFAANGYQRASLNAVAKRLGIAKGSLYQYFGNKEGLFLFIFERFTDLVKEALAASVGSGEEGFFTRVRQALVTGVRFIDRNPLFFNLYLKVLFEHEVPQREKLISKVRLFSRDYFGPICREGIRRGELRAGVDVAVTTFILDAVFDRFLQGLVQPYLDGGLGLAAKDPEALTEEIDLVLEVLQQGLGA